MQYLIKSIEFDCIELIIMPGQQRTINTIKQVAQQPKMCN